eukprot:12084091-Alexandrium_andersonii.AAC.1
MGAPMGTPTPSDPSQPTGPASSSSAAPAAPPAGLATAPIAAPPGLAPVGAVSADMEGVEDGGEDDVVVIGQT